MSDVNQVRRVTPLPYDEWDTAALSVLAPGRRLPQNNVLGLFARHPELAKSFLTFSKYLFESSLPARTRELAILRVAWRRRCRYEWAQHLLIARKAGVTDEELAQAWEDPTTLVNRAVDELDTDSKLSDQTYAELAAELDDRQIMDFVFTVGAYALLAMAFNSFEVELEPGVSDEDFDTHD
ncbi:carboxymuconolactone decarboxylase family protein [Catenulispora rubra]|uniref:carboxymuconolactone decarboxylase family protein n=1 Tax=Catenulispora rubra TaxID=280293 RepID=UPI00189209EC|nr:carboxymuconolactone decarboxylase family protein [Catenulispora rubra]